MLKIDLADMLVVIRKISVVEDNFLRLKMSDSACNTGNCVLLRRFYCEKWLDFAGEEWNLAIR